jgi:hypothetical protein
MNHKTTKRQPELLTDCLHSLVLSAGHRERRAATLQNQKTIVTQSKPPKSVTFATATVTFHTSNFIDPLIQIRSTEGEESKANELS